MAASTTAGTGSASTAETTLNQMLDQLEDTGLLGDIEALYQAFSEWAAARGRNLYEHQDAALVELLDGRHVIAQTPTGSGKSLIALAGHFISLARGGRSYYTAPLKALVSEKFFELVEAFGAHNVGMVTGEVSINGEAPIICCTAEILANRTLREGKTLDADMVIMDEFHFYADPQRGWAWQIPLLELTAPQFVALSATLGDTSGLRQEIEQRTGRPVAEITGASRPVPLEYEYCVDELQPTVERLLAEDRAPIYIAHFVQAEAVTTAKSLASLPLIDRERKAKIAEVLKGTKFAKGFGAALKTLLLSGIGVHHAGMLPRYRRVVERLAQQGLLAVISGTDTLGVGINVPIRTVLFTALVKYDGNRTRHLSAREFHQIAGRAGRAGFDQVGYVRALATEQEVEAARRRARINAAQAEANEKKLKKLARSGKGSGKGGGKGSAKQNVAGGDKKATWTQATFTRLVEAEPETLRSQFHPSFSMVLNTLQGPGDPEQRLIGFARADSAQAQVVANPHLRRLGEIFRSLRLAGVVEKVSAAQAAADGLPRLRVVRELPDDFALNQPLAPFALAALELLDPESPEFDLDILSVVESVMESPQAILFAQQRRARDLVMQALRDEGASYDQRQNALAETTWPQPLAETLEAAFQIYAQSNPWVAGHNLVPKSIVREMVEEGFTFSQFISRYDLEAREGVLLRYLSDTYRALTQMLPDAYVTPQIAAIREWLHSLLEAIDSSLIDEWEQLAQGEEMGLSVAELLAARTGETGNKAKNPSNTATGDTSEEAAELAFGEGFAGMTPWQANGFLLRKQVRNRLFDLVEAAARDDVDALAEASQGVSADVWDRQLARFWAEHEWVGVDQQARSSEFFDLNEHPSTADLLDWLAVEDESRLPRTQAGTLDWWFAEQVIVDEDDTREWRIVALIDPQASAEAMEIVWKVLGLRVI